MHFFGIPHVLMLNVKHVSPLLLQRNAGMISVRLAMHMFFHHH